MLRNAQKRLILAVLFFTSLSCLLNKSWIDRNWLFQLLSHRKRCRINGFQIFPWLITYCEWTEGNFLNSFFVRCFQGTRVFPRKTERVDHIVWLRLGSLEYTVALQSILKSYTCITCAVSDRIPQERSTEVMGNRCGSWASSALPYLFHSFQVWDEHTVSCVHWHTPYHPGGRLLTPTSQIVGSADQREEALCSVLYTQRMASSGTLNWTR